MNTLYIGIDNGVTGSIGLIADGLGLMVLTPVKNELSYTKKEQHVTRIDSVKLLRFLDDHIVQYDAVRALIERPMVNPKMFKATLSAMRALEATLNVLEILNIGYSYTDSKIWQKELLPQGVKGPDLKTASAQIAVRLYPNNAEIINKHKDGDGILIAHYLQMQYRHT